MIILGVGFYSLDKSLKNNMFLEGFERVTILLGGRRGWGGVLEGSLLCLQQPVNSVVITCTRDVYLAITTIRERARKRPN